MGDLIMCITSGGQKMVGEDYSVPPHHMKPKSALKKWPILVSKKKIRFKHKPVAQLSDVITRQSVFEETGNVANEDRTLEGRVVGLCKEKPDNEASETVLVLNTAKLHL